MATQKIEKEQARFENIAQKVGLKYGYREVTVEMTAYADFKLRWTRTYQKIDFSVSDYLMGAPDDVIENIFDVVFSRIVGEFKEYSDTTKDWLTREEFAGKARKTYLSRHKAQAEQYKAFKGTSVHVSSKDMHLMAYCSTLFNTIVLNKDVVANAPADVIDNLIRYEYNILQEGKPSFGLTSETVECDEISVRGFARRFGLGF